MDETCDPDVAALSFVLLLLGLHAAGVVYLARIAQEDDTVHEHAHDRPEEESYNNII